MPSFTLATLTAATATAGTTGTAVAVGRWNRAIIVLDVTSAAVAAGDILDMYVDVSPDNSKWLGAVYFTRVLGSTGTGKCYSAILDPTNPGAVVFDMSTRPAVGVTRPGAFGPWMRVYYVITSATAPVFTATVKAYVQ